MSLEKDKNEKFKRNTSNAYLKYSGMVFQLFILLLLAAFAGEYLDEKMSNETPYFTAALLVLALIAYLVKLGIDLSKP